ncbi:hypothetical protein KFL_000430060 [Klebsormidium nitens]|uniref:Uncharacterized protein n=1 Tax=Klebsormidium nitens TaxID=105231 RepID=A0A1Y1HMW6_KLENI|nr:hypothetical protein KFL_000430060 [Klebsormidium nitens]|eukprot:GAQ79964.1 hypothetical protein KFL_000430060 [Klebsormidium nitens]
MATGTARETSPTTSPAAEFAPGTSPCLTPKSEPQAAPGIMSPALSRPLFPDTPPTSDERRSQGPNPAQGFQAAQNSTHQSKPEEEFAVNSAIPEHDQPNLALEVGAESAQNAAQDSARIADVKPGSDPFPDIDPGTSRLDSKLDPHSNPDSSSNGGTSPITLNPARDPSPNPALNPDQKPAASCALPPVEQLLEDLVSDPPKWSALNWAVNNDRGLLYAMEEAVKARGAAALRARLERERARLDADAVWAMNQPLLSLVHFIVTGENDVHRKTVRVKELKRIICAKMALGAPTKGALETRVRGETPVPRQQKKEAKKEGKPERRKKRKGMEDGGMEALATAAETHTQGIKRVRKPAKRSGGTGRAEGDGNGSDGKTLHQLVAERQNRKRDGKFSAGIRPEEAAWVLAEAANQRNKSEGLGSPRGRKGKCANAPRNAARAQGPVHIGGDGEQEAIEALVYSLRARANKRGRRHVSDADDREGLESESAGQGTEMAGEKGGCKGVKEAKERCMWAIMDLLDVLPPELDLNAVEVFKELGATKAFDDSLGYLASKARARARKEWDALKRAAEDARATELEAIAKRRAVGERLGIEVAAALHAKDMKEHNAVYSAFQVRLIDLRREMERHVARLEMREGVAKRAWLAYNNVTTSQAGAIPQPLTLPPGQDR